MTEPNTAEIDGGAPAVLFSGKKWPVPKLAIKQLRQITEKCDRLADVVIAKQTPMNEYTQADFDDLCTVLFVALTRAHPALSREEFDEMPTDKFEVTMAFMTVYMQANATPKAPASGEAEGPASP